MSRIVVLALVVIISLATAFVVPLPKLKKPEEVHQKWKGTVQPFNHAQMDTRTPPLPLLDATVKMASAATASYQPSPVELEPMEIDEDEEMMIMLLEGNTEPCEVMGLCQVTEELEFNRKASSGSTAESNVPLLRRVLSHLLSQWVAGFRSIKQAITAFLNRLSSGTNDFFQLLSFLVPQRIRQAVSARTTPAVASPSGVHVQDAIADSRVPVTETSVRLSEAPVSRMSEIPVTMTEREVVLVPTTEFAVEEGRQEEAMATAAAVMSLEGMGDMTMTIAPLEGLSEEEEAEIVQAVLAAEQLVEEAGPAAEERASEEAQLPLVVMKAVEESERDDDDEGGQAMLTQLESVGTQMESAVQHMEEAVVDEPVPVVREGVLASFFGGEEVTEEERAAVSSLKDKLVSVPARTYAWMTDVDLLRYVRQSRGRVEGAYARVLKTLAWREEHEIDKLADLDLNKSPLHRELFWLNGRDNAGNPILVFRTAQHEPGAVSPSDFTRHVLSLLEKGRRDFGLGHSCQVTLLVDRVDSGLRNQEPSLVGEIVPLLQAHYPNTLSVAHVAPVNWFLFIIWTVFRLLLDNNTAQRINLITGDWQQALRQYVTEDQLPSHLGGRLNEYPSGLATAN